MFYCMMFIYALITSFIANSYLLIEKMPKSIFVLAFIFAFLVLFSGVFFLKTRSKKIKICYHGTILLVSVCVATLISVPTQIVMAIVALFYDSTVLLSNVLFCIGTILIVFIIGILSVYLTSTQLGIKKRLICAILGLIPVLNVVALFVLIKTTAQECLFEIKKEELNKKRKEKKVCQTKYPILLVHGIFVRDTKYFNYWGRIPDELEKNGAQIFYGNHHSATSVADSATELKERIFEVLKQTKAQKVNVIAHSKGGIDCRYAIAKLGMQDYIASLTTINTPHRGCFFADYLLKQAPKKLKMRVADTYNKTLKKLGDDNPDFLAAVSNLTVDFCKKLDAEMPLPDGIFCQSVGSVVKKAKSGKFPANVCYHVVKHFSGENDGVVAEKSFKWSKNYILLRPIKKRGISHTDMIDFNRENIPGFDVREFYVKLVNDLKNRGL